MEGTFDKPFRRTAVTAGAVLAALVATSTGPSNQAAAGEPATNKTAGTASATATSYKVNPTTASLSIGITFGISLAGYTNQVAQAESRGLDLGIIGTTLAGEGCDGGDPTMPAEDQPQPLRADSRDPGASTEKSEQEKYLPVITKAVRADATPYGQSDTTTAALTGSGSFVSLGSAHSQAITRLADGNREAIATVDIGSVGIAGVVELANLHWEAKAQSGTIDKTTGTFTIGSLKVLGQAVPSSDALSAIENAERGPAAARHSGRLPEGAHRGGHPVRRPARDPRGPVEDARHDQPDGARPGPAGAAEPVRRPPRSGLRQRHLHHGERHRARFAHGRRVVLPRARGRPTPRPKRSRPRASSTSTRRWVRRADPTPPSATRSTAERTSVRHRRWAARRRRRLAPTPGRKHQAARHLSTASRRALAEAGWPWLA